MSDEKTDERSARESGPRSWAEIIAADPDHSRRYAERWESFARAGKDIDGEARLVDALAARSSRILDAGCGQGRVGGYLAARGHRVTGLDIDPYLIGVAAEAHRSARWVVGDLADLGRVLRDAVPAIDPIFDVVVAAGNVLTFIDPADRERVLGAVAAVLAPGGRAVLGFGAGRGWDFADFENDAAGAGLTITGRFATWDVRPFGPASDFLVAVCERD